MLLTAEGFFDCAATRLCVLILAPVARASACAQDARSNAIPALALVQCEKSHGMMVICGDYAPAESIAGYLKLALDGAPKQTAQIGVSRAAGSRYNVAY
jgi:hypothetical protein